MTDLINHSTLPTPTIVKTTTQDEKLLFTVANVDVSIVNAFRRTILSDIPVICIRSETHETNKVKISVNTSRMHNEMLAQRISCVPIYSVDPDFCDKYQLELDVTNDTEDRTMIVTTEHFRLRRILRLEPLELGDLIPPEESRKIFPADSITQQYIDIVYLRPAVGSIPGERIALTARFEWHVGDSGDRKPANTSMSYTVDVEAANRAWENHEKKMLSESVDPAIIATTKQDFYLLDAKRICIPNSFDLWVQSFGIYQNHRLVELAGNVLRKKLRQFMIDVDSNVIPIHLSCDTKMHGYLGVIESSVANSWDVILLNEGDTMGNMLCYAILDLFFDQPKEDEKEVLYCAHKKFHPDHSFGVLRVVLRENNPSNIRRILAKACEELGKVVALVKP